MITYTRNGSATTESIELAPANVRYRWNLLSSNGINIARVRSVINRNEFTNGKTFRGIHLNKVSAYKQQENPTKKIYFSKRVPVGESNVGMQVLSVPSNLDMQETLVDFDEVLRLYNANIFVRTRNNIISYFK